MNNAPIGVFDSGVGGLTILRQIQRQLPAESIVYIGDNGEQHHSTASEFPVLIIGGESSGLRTGGRTLVYPGLGSAGHRQVSNLWNTLGHVAGVELDAFGTEGPTRVAPGPLGELMG